jgi:predicted PurR-regulated permease PerM
VIKNRITAIGGEINGYVSAFVRGQITIGVILTALYAVGLGAFVGVELWFLIAVIAGMGSLIPYFGLITGVLLGSIMALVTFGDLQHLIYTWLVFIVVQFVTDTFITPKVVGAGVGLSPLVVILALLAGGQLFGLLGLFLWV